MKPEEIWSIWDEVVGVDMGFDPVPFANAIIDAVPTVGLERIAQILACEIECGIFEQHVAPALDIARKAMSAPAQGADLTPEIHMSIIEQLRIAAEMRRLWIEQLMKR